jgi:hypothetical protein
LNHKTLCYATDFDNGYVTNVATRPQKEHIIFDDTFFFTQLAAFFCELASQKIVGEAYLFSEAEGRAVSSERAVAQPPRAKRAKLPYLTLR